MNILRFIKKSNPIEFLNGYWRYEDDDGGDWYVPLDYIYCKLCRGSGELCHSVDDDYCEQCFDCNGTGYIEKPQYDLVMSGDDYRSDQRIRRYLERRYGRIPSDISDYWQGQS